MQQPLTHLYFLIILENVSNLQFGLSGLITTSQKIAKVFSTYTVWVCPFGACRCVLMQFVSLCIGVSCSYIVLAT